MNRLLVIAHQFPPAGGIGVQRILRFCRDLPKHHWMPHILTGTAEEYPLQDPTLLDQLHPGSKIFRIELPPLIRKFFPKLNDGLTKKINGRNRLPGNLGYQLWIYDDFYPWIGAAYIHGKKILKRFDYDAILSTGSPFCSLILGHLLARHGNIPHLVDFRDGWYKCEYRRDRGYIPNRLEGALEKRIIAHCHKAFFVTHSLKDQYASRYPQHHHKLVCLPNGYDKKLRSCFEKPPVEKNGLLKIKYIGKFTHYRRPDAFLKGLKKAVYDYGIKNIAVEFVGGLDHQAHNLIEEMKLSEYIDVTDFLPHADAIKAMSRADVLLLIVDKTPGYQVIQTGKIFEYMLTRQPILCISPLDSEAVQTVDGQNLGVSIPPPDDTGIATALMHWAGMKKKSGTIDKMNARLSPDYNLTNILTELARNLNEVCFRSIYQQTAEHA